ncbi:MAG: TldD/PmbA family protein [Myxococcales bacterium FL481]|nr:MAG: TldD/PmbA family protein [Myxococcales bacterium FL481]
MPDRPDQARPFADSQPAAEGGAASEPQDGPSASTVLAAMEAELARSVEGLKVPANPRPYYLAYALRRIRGVELVAAHGSLLRNRATDRSSVFVDIRVGSRRFDNLVDGGLDAEATERESADWLAAPDDLDLDELRVALWKQTQLKFDEAIEDYYEHRKALVSEYLRDEVEAFSHERPTIYIEPFDATEFPRALWADTLRELSRRFLEHPQVHDPRLSIRADRLQRWLCTNEGSRVVTEDRYIEFSVEGWVLTDDGVYVEADRRFYLRSLDEMPDREAMDRAIDDVLAELEELARAEPCSSFIGPALLAGQAAATVFHEAFGHRVEGERFVSRGETRTFAHKVGQRILPPGLDIYDDPTRTHVGEESLWGSYRIDDQGVPAERANLVEDGVLQGFLTSRTPTRSSHRSNGHGRHDGVEGIMARMGNLIAEGSPERARSWDDLVTDLVDLARRQGRTHAALVRRIRAGETSTGSYDFQVFKGELADVVLIEVSTGKHTRIRDVELIGTPLSALQRVIAYGGADEADHGFCFAESGAVPVSGVSPALLISEVELQQSSTTAFHEPLLPPPFADDGSRGRRGRLRARGRRRPRGET